LIIITKNTILGEERYLTTSLKGQQAKDIFTLEYLIQPIQLMPEVKLV